MAGKPKKFKSSLQETLALLNDPAPKDFDPEAFELKEDNGVEEEREGSDESGDEVSEDENAGREHYIAVGRSKLRKAADMTLLDPKYDGSRVSRNALADDESAGDSQEDDDDDGSESESDEESSQSLNSDEMDLSKMEINSEDDEDIDSDMAMGESDEEKFSGFRFKGSNTTKDGVVPKRGDKVADFSSDEEMSDGSGSGSEEDDDESMDDDDDESAATSESESDSDSEEKRKREELKKMIAEEQKVVVSNVSKAVRADIDKGIAVRKQQATFDGFLGARIKMQKALVAANSLPSNPEEEANGKDSLQAAEEAVLKLWNMVSDMRAELQKLEDDKASKRKRKYAEFGADISEMWTDMEKFENSAKDTRESTLDKWWNKTQGVQTIQLNQKLNNKTVAHTITGQLRETLNDSDRLVKKTRMPRSCAPVQSAKEIEEDPEIFDDTDFYQLLLKALVDQKITESSSGVGAAGVRWATAIREAKTKKKVDTKASKGRKLRYQVHEKLQNFMAPNPTISWQDGQIDDLFSSLLGQRARVNEASDEESEDEIQDDGIRLFG